MLFNRFISENAVGYLRWKNFSTTGFQLKWKI